MVRIRWSPFTRFACAALLVAPSFALAVQTPPVAPTPDLALAAKWQAVEIDFSYLGMTSFYSCDSLERKVETLLKSIGAHEKTRVSASGCESSGPSRHAFVHISAGVPVPVTDIAEPTAKESARASLIKRLGTSPVFDQQAFQASRRTIDLSRGRGSVFEPGDCELIDQLARDVLPKLGTTTVDSAVSCFPGQVPMTTPPFKVDVLVRIPNADESKKSR